MNKILVAIFALALAACQPASENETAEAPEAAPEMEAAEMSEPASEAAAAVDEASNTLAAVLDAQPDEVKARYQYRHPQETLEFFGVEPGMTVVEALPGGGWYTKILVPVLAEDGRYIAAGGLGKAMGFGDILGRVNRTRGYGDYYHYHRLAAGQLDAVIESDVNILDIAAMVVIVREAGGVFTDLEGAQPALNTTSVLAATPGLHERLLAMLAP